jgi:hypothetical protein
VVVVVAAVSKAPLEVVPVVEMEQEVEGTNLPEEEHKGEMMQLQTLEAAAAVLPPTDLAAEVVLVVLVSSLS